MKHRTTAGLVVLIVLAFLWAGPLPSVIAQNLVRIAGSDSSGGAQPIGTTSDALKVTGTLTTNAGTITLVAPFRVAVGATCVQLTASAGLKGVTIMPIAPGQTIYLGSDNTCTTANGFPLTNGQPASFTVSNSNQIWAIASAAAQAVSVFPWQ